MYTNLIPELGCIHQLCIFHLIQMAGKKVFPKLNSKIKPKREKIEYALYFTEIKNIFRTTDIKQTMERFEDLYSKIDRIPKDLKKIVEKIQKDFLKLTEHFINPGIASTSNAAENYYRRTDPDQIKHKYKTNNGILSYLKLQMEKITEKQITRLKTNQNNQKQNKKHTII